MVDLARNMVYNMNPELVAECEQTSARMEAEAGRPKEQERQRRAKERADQEQKREERRQSRRIRAATAAEQTNGEAVDLTDAAELDALQKELEATSAALNASLEVASDPGTDDLLGDSPPRPPRVATQPMVQPQSEDYERDELKDKNNSLGAQSEAPAEEASEAVEGGADEEVGPAATQFFNAGEEIEEDAADEMQMDTAPDGGDQGAVVEAAAVDEADGAVVAEGGLEILSGFQPLAETCPATHR
jgi:hypothetical protein